MPLSSCPTCGKEFATTTALNKHKERKNPCKPPLTLIQGEVNKALKDAGVPHLEVPTTEFRENSKSFHSSLTKEQRLKEGIFFTPKKARDILFAKLAELGIRPTKILEPSFGSGEFLLDARRIYPTAKLTGVELNDKLFDAVKCPGSTLISGDFLEWKPKETNKHDLILGNPPYFVLKGAKPGYEKAMTGRPNIYVLFLYKCLEEHLESDGFLAFIIPTSLYNCSYYQPMRDYIHKNTTILHLESLTKPGFYETAQETMLMILQNKKMNDNYIFHSKTNKIYISPYYKELYELTKESKTLVELGLGVKTGNVVWNQEKQHLADEGTLLIYSSNINKCELKLDNLGGNERKQYVKGITKPTLSGPVILVERGYGHSMNLNAVLVNLKNFYAENHINIIYPKTEDAVKNLEKVIESFKDLRTKKFIEYFIANGSVSATDMETLVPIY